MTEEQVEIITLTQEDGVEKDFEVITYFEHPTTGIKYVFLVSADDSDDEEQDVYAFRYAEEGDDLILEEAESDEEWQMLEEVLDTLIDSEQV